MFNFCYHKWQIIGSSIGIATYEGERTREISVILLQCERCGDIKDKIVDGKFLLVKDDKIKKE